MKLVPLPDVVDRPAIRHAGREALSLALMDARNHTLQLLGAHEAAGVATGAQVLPDDGPPAAWIAGHAAWLAEWWTVRHPQRSLGPLAPAGAPRLASADPRADGWFHAEGPRWRHSLPPPDALRAYLIDQIEGTIELLESAAETDDALHLFRAALFHEDACGEHLAVRAQTVGVNMPLQAPAAQAPRAALWLPATRWQLGGGPEGFATALERPARWESVPAFEIDAQPVCWAQFVEFVADGGYDHEPLWHPEGWAWVQATGRRSPRHVEQIGVRSGAVTQAFFGRLHRLSGSQPVMHVSWWEADAYARWASRRLPTEVEWEIAAQSASARGFCWGDVQEWTGGTLRPWPGYCADAWAVGTALDPAPAWGQARVLRGASFASRRRMKHPKARGFALPREDEGFIGFRTCAA